MDNPFENFSDEYDSWFDRNPHLFESEIKALKAAQKKGRSLEIGIGTGQFAVPLGIGHGVEPAPQMYKKLAGSGIHIINGVAEALPYKPGAFDFVLIVTSICFVKEPLQAVGEAYRVLRKGGRLSIAIVDRESTLGKVYLAKKDKSLFYAEAKFFSSHEIYMLMFNSGFKDISALQTLFSMDKEKVDEPEPGYGKGSFVVISGEKL
ncbi:class I SAM-dependent methyltransferase [Limisalsivibrio acetivorans]|uniref:class I SAM-dependent methyltransferase n=1 Tax=Limisalsivibrio acetivorans TaxID=1304888 RepID=UPI0003B6E00F|nr:class I SAM-dependent methyltransferase [Limisalsivibrio acetivorans]